MDRSDEGGDPACWAHLFEDEPDGERGDEDTATSSADGSEKLAPRGE